MKHWVFQQKFGMNKQYQQGDDIPNGISPTYFVILHGHFVKKVNLSGEQKFPKLEDPKMVYVAFG